MPAVRHSADLGEDISFPGVDHYVMTLHIGGASVQRLDRPDLSNFARRGSLSLQAPHSGIRLRFHGNVEYAHLYFKQSLLCEVGDELGIAMRSELEDFFARNDVGNAETILDYIGRALDADDPATSLEMDARAYLIVDGLLRSLTKDIRDDTAPLSAARRDDITNALDLIEANLDDPLRLSHLADATGMSVYHFARVFRAVMDETPAEYLMRRRAEHARRLITETDKPLGAIAVETGFSSQSHMTRRIRQEFGTTPGELRRSRD